MVGSQPYQYASPQHHGSQFDFNPRAYSQAAYSASVQSLSPRPKQEGPLLDFNKHPDSWMVVSPSVGQMPNESQSLSKKIVSVRWVQFAFRILQFFGAWGMFFCIVVTKGIPDTQAWIMRIPPAFDGLLLIYAIYHLVRPAGKRPAASSASYHFFATLTDSALIPFYVYSALGARAVYHLPTGSDGRWTTFFNEQITTIILTSTWYGGIVMGGLHLVSIILDVLLLAWFRKIANMHPDWNPLDTGIRASKHKHKTSEYSISTKHLSMDSTGSAASLPHGYTVPSIDDRKVAFMSSRADPSFSAHTRASAQAARSSPTPRSSMYQQLDTDSREHLSPRTNSIVSSKLSLSSPKFPLPPGHSAMIQHPTQGQRTDIPRIAIDSPKTPRSGRAQSPLAQMSNWTVHEDPTHQQQRVLPTPPTGRQHQAAALGPYDMPTGAAGDKENAAALRRQLTVSSSVYSGDNNGGRDEDEFDGVSIHSVGTAKVRYYGDLGVRRADEDGEGRVPMGQSCGNRIGSSGVDEGEAPRYRNVSGRGAEEGLGRGWR